MLISVNDPDDPRLAAYRDIRERDLVGRRGLFIAEGKVVLAALAASETFAPDSVLILRNRLDGMSAVLDNLPEATPVYVADAPVLDAVAGFPMHRGVLAIGRRKDLPTRSGLIDGLPGRAIVVVLVGASNHDNVGSVFRNAAAFGASAVLLDATSCDPLYRKAIRVSVGHVFSVPFLRGGTADEIVATLAAAGFAIVALSPRGDLEIGDFRPAARTALVVGTEGEGLPADLLARLTTLRIGIAPAVDSLNLATATAIALHRLRTNSQA